MNEKLEKKIKAIDKLLLLFKDNFGNKLSFTETQKQIIYSIILKDCKKMGVITPTGYGKSTATAVGIIIDSVINGEQWLIVGGTADKANIIMTYIINHIFDNELFLSQLEISDSLERLKRTRRKDDISFKLGGKISITSADYRNQKRIGEIITGKHCKNVVIDDSVLCDDNLYAYIKNIISGYGDDYFLLELSNPLKRNHFFKLMTVRDDRVKKIWIDCYKAIQEGRLTQNFVEERKDDPFFEVFYECKFPESDFVDEQGYVKLLKDETIENCFEKEIKIGKSIENILGIDVGRGGNNSVICLRNDDKAKIVFSGQIKNLMNFVGIIVETIKKYDVNSNKIFIDDIGVGGGVVDRLKEQKINVIAVRWSEKSKDKKFANIKSESFWRLKKWLENDGKIEYNEMINNQLLTAKYKINSSGQIVMQSKDEMITMGFDSPDELDALVLTFTPTFEIKIDVEDKITNKTDLLNEVLTTFDNDEFTFLK